MTPQPQLDARPATDSNQPLAAEPICPHCGGSGTLRHGDQLFRTCLECLGQGRLQQLTDRMQARERAAQRLAPAQVIGVQRRERVSAVASSAAAR